jgi:transcription initiation factor TFIIB
MFTESYDFLVRLSASAHFRYVADTSAGDIVCRGCGLVLGERIIDESAEWINYANDDRQRGDQSRAAEFDVVLSASGSTFTVVQGGDTRVREALQRANQRSSFSSRDVNLRKHFQTLAAIARDMTIRNEVAVSIAARA